MLHLSTTQSSLWTDGAEKNILAETDLFSGQRKIRWLHAPWISSRNKISGVENFSLRTVQINSFLSSTIFPQMWTQFVSFSMVRRVHDGLHNKTMNYYREFKWRNESLYMNVSWEWKTLCGIKKTYKLWCTKRSVLGTLEILINTIDQSKIILNCNSSWICFEYGVL